MKIIAHFNAILTIDSPWDEVRPVKGPAFAIISQAIKERYNFQAVGQSSVSQQIGLMTPGFQNGQFKMEDKFFPINQLEFQPGTILISSATTEQASKFAEDLFDFLHKTLDFRLPPANRARHYATSIIVDFGTSFASLFGTLNEVARLLNRKTKNEKEFAPFGVRFVAGDTPDNLAFERQFILEHRAIAPPGENWIYSQAPLDSEAHVELLKEIDKLMNR